MRCSTAILIAASLSIGSLAVAQDCQLQLSSRSFEVGESADAQLVCTNTELPETPQIVTSEGVELSITNPTPMMSSMTSIINGRTSKRTTYTFPLRIVAKQKGNHQVGPITVRAGRETYKVDPVRVIVRETTSNAGARGDQLAFVTITVDRMSLYVSESFKATLTIGIRRVYVDDQLVDFDNLLQTVDARSSNLSQFGPRFTPSEQWINDSKGGRHRYVLYKDTKDFRAEDVGDFNIGPIFLKVNYPTAFRRSFWGRGLEVARSQPVTARSDAVTVNIKAPDLAGRPDDFTGAIGQYSIRADAKPLRVEQGQPITLIITVSGTPVEGVAGPDLSNQPDLASRFDFVADELVGDVESGSKVFRRAIFPKQVGEQTVPSISWAYFDPKREQYVSLTTKPIDIVVDPPSPGSRTVMLEDTSQPTSASGLTVLSGGISPNYVEPGRVLADHSLHLAPSATVAILVAPPALWLAALIVVGRRRRLRSDIGFARRRKALREGRALVTHAMRAPDNADQLKGLAYAMTTYIANRFHLPPGEVTPSDVRSILSGRLGDEATVEEVASFLGDCDALRYAPGLAANHSPQETAARVRGWMDRIERNGTR